MKICRFYFNGDFNKVDLLIIFFKSTYMPTYMATIWYSSLGLVGLIWSSWSPKPGKDGV